MKETDLLNIMASILLSRDEGGLDTYSMFKAVRNARTIVNLNAVYEESLDDTGYYDEQYDFLTKLIKHQDYIRAGKYSTDATASGPQGKSLGSPGDA